MLRMRKKRDFKGNYQFSFFVERKKVGSFALNIDQESDYKGLWSVVIKPEYRNMGYGSKMMQELIEWCNQRNFKLYGFVEPRNEIAIRMYEKVGFKYVNQNDYQLGERWGAAGLICYPEFFPEVLSDIQFIDDLKTSLIAQGYDVQWLKEYHDHYIIWVRGDANWCNANWDVNNYPFVHDWGALQDFKSHPHKEDKTLVYAQFERTQP